MNHPILVSAAVIVERGKILLAQRRENDHLAGCWEFPGGKVAEDEAPDRALVRELREELDIEIRVTSRESFIYWEYPEKRILLLFFRGSILSGIPRPVECQAVEWFDLDAVSSLNLAPADARAWSSLSARLYLEQVETG
jgi:8-oxo-dGTP diphosphatase